MRDVDAYIRPEDVNEYYRMANNDDFVNRISNLNICVRYYYSLARDLGMENDGEWSNSHPLY